MKYAVYWQPDDIECRFFKTEAEARQKVADLIQQNEDAANDGRRPYWDITLLKVMGEVHEVPYDGALALEETNHNMPARRAA